MEIEIPDALLQLHAITNCNTMVSKKVSNDPSSLTLIKMLRSNITKTQEVVQTIVQTIIYSEKLNQSYVSTRVPLNENLK